MGAPLTWASLLFVALGLAADATAVSVARGLAVPVILPRHAALVALFFGGAQGVMPLIGGLIGGLVGPFVATVDHWIAFAVLSAVGGKMLWEVASGDEDTVDATKDPFDLRLLAVLAVATSLDALAVGVTLPMLGAPLLSSCAVIAVVTGVASIAGLFAGRWAGAALGRRVDALGGLALIGIGTKILVEHLTGS